MKKVLLMLLFAFTSVSLFAQLSGSFGYGQDGHVYFYLTNNTNYNIPISFWAQNQQKHESRYDQVTIYRGNTFFFGPNYYWLWEQGETFTIRYSNGQSYYWTCPYTEPNIVNMRGSNRAQSANNHQRSQNNSSRGVRLSNVPSKGEYKFGNGYYMYLVNVFEKDGYNKVGIIYREPGNYMAIKGGTFFLQQGWLVPDNETARTANPAASFLYSLNGAKVDFGPNMSYLIINGKRINRPTEIEMNLYEGLGKSSFEYNNGGNSSYSGSSGGSSSNSNRSRGRRCGRCDHGTVRCFHPNYSTSYYDCTCSNCGSTHRSNREHSCRCRTCGGDGWVD